jgi:hypothetical protein
MGLGLVNKSKAQLTLFSFSFLFSLSFSWLLLNFSGPAHFSYFSFILSLLSRDLPVLLPLALIFLLASSP